MEKKRLIDGKKTRIEGKKTRIEQIEMRKSKEGVYEAVDNRSHCGFNVDADYRNYLANMQAQMAAQGSMNQPNQACLQQQALSPYGQPAYGSGSALGGLLGGMGLGRLP